MISSHQAGVVRTVAGGVAARRFVALALKPRGPRGWPGRGSVPRIGRCGAALGLLALVIAPACRNGSNCGSASIPVRAGDSEPRDPSVVVAVHSWTGRTAAVGGELAAMLGGRLVRFADAPFPETALGGRTVEQAVADLGDLGGVRDLYLGFPVWDEMPSRPILALVTRVRLSGIRVIPFYTYLHYIRPDSLEALRVSLRERGAHVVPEMSFLLPANASTEDAVARARRALLGRPDLWAAAHPDVSEPCQGGRCPVPAGKVWIGDTGDDAALGAPPPRLYAVDAFSIDEGEVTIAEYAHCVAAGVCSRVDLASSFCRELVKGGDRLPLPCVSFTAAEAYCKWDDRHLPLGDEFG